MCSIESKSNYPFNFPKSSRVVGAAANAYSANFLSTQTSLTLDPKTIAENGGMSSSTVVRLVKGVGNRPMMQCIDHNLQVNAGMCNASCGHWNNGECPFRQNVVQKLETNETTDPENLSPTQTVYCDIDGTIIMEDGSENTEIIEMLNSIRTDRPDSQIIAITNRPSSQGTKDCHNIHFDSEVFREDMAGQKMSPQQRLQLLRNIDTEALERLKSENPVLLRRYLDRETSKIDYIASTLKKPTRVKDLAFLYDNDVDGEIAEYFGFGRHIGETKPFPKSNKAERLLDFDEDSIVNSLVELPPDRMIQFLNASAELLRILAQRKVGQLLVPERSAVPYAWAMRELSQSGIGSPIPKICLLPIGKLVDRKTGFTVTRLTDEHLHFILDQTAIADENSVLICEVNTGIIATKLARVINEHLKEASISFVFLENSLVNRHREPKANGRGYYTRRITNRSAGYSDLKKTRSEDIDVIDTPLIFDDNDLLLDVLLFGSYPQGDSECFNIPEIVNNQVAERLVSIAAKIYTRQLSRTEIPNIIKNSFEISERNQERLITWLEALIDEEP